MEDDNPLFGIDLSSSEDEFTNPEMTKPSKPPRDFQSEEDFQCTMQSYKPKVENGEVGIIPCSSLCFLRNLFYPSSIPNQGNVQPKPQNSR
jgi:hypothetical protein